MRGCAIRWELLVLGMFVWLLGCGEHRGGEQVAGIQQALTGTVSGTVIGDGSPLVGASVEALLPATTTVVGTALTDAAGKYALALDQGTYDLRVTPPSGGAYQPRLVEGVASTGTVTHDLVLLSASERTLSGTLTVNGQPLEGATVTVSVSGYWGALITTSTVSGPSGNYSLAVPSGGSTGVAISSSAVPQVSCSGGIAVNGMTILDIPLQTSTLSGIVSAGGAPVGGMPVYARSIDSSSPLRCTSTAEAVSAPDGKFLVLALHGQASVDVRPPPGSSYGDGSVSIPFQADTSVGIDLPLPTSVLSGTIRGMNGQAVIGASVSANGTSHTSSTTDTNGHYSLSVVPGDYDLIISGGTGSVPAFYECPQENVAVNGPTTFDFQLQGSTLTGTVMANGAPQAGVTLSAQTRPGWSNICTSRNDVISGPGGTFSVTSLHGTVVVDVTPPQASTYGATDLWLDFAAGSNIVVDLPAKTVVSGKLLGIDGQPVAGADVTARQLSAL
ncbi:MAG TPA: carboxypeptidase-like regulatory domain-containing protein, partial [Polyangiaceae bacterium]|nr:carboxypeptidase-like regulatory domain-containing protein [Polyangiaceae bacterium]